MKNGIPIYNDKKCRDIVDNLDVKDNSWYPSNKVAQLLWRCLESLRDISTLLDSFILINDETKQKRIIKSVATPLHSLASEIGDLCNNITCNPDTNRDLPKKKIKEIANINKHFGELLSVKWDSDLSQLRNKLSAHIDKNIYPSEANNILQKNDTALIGKYIHICLHVLVDLLELKIFAWTCELENHPTWNIMTNEPFLVCLAMNDDKPEYINCIHVVNNSPKETIVKTIEEIVQKSQFMFGKNEIRIYSISKNKKGNREKFITNFHRYKKI